MNTQLSTIDHRPTILFLGTPTFAVPILEALHKQFKVVGVVTQPDRPAGRKKELTPTPVKIKAEELKIPVYQPETAGEIPGLIQESFDFLITAAYGEYLPDEVLRLPKKDALNIHPSLLPKYRGATPIQSALLNGDTKTGVTIVRMAKIMDAGPIFAQEELNIDPSIKYPELNEQCSHLGKKLISEVLKNYDATTPVEQEGSFATHCKKITKEDGLIHWDKESAEQIYNKLRAYAPWPGVYTEFKKQKLSILEFSANCQLLISNHSPGTIFQTNHQIFIQCQSGCIQLQTVQLAGKKPTDIHSFLNGHPDFVGVS